MARTKNWSGSRKQNPNNNPSAKIANTSSNAVRTESKLSGEWKPQQHEKAYFNGGSSLDWMKFKPRMEAAFVENECFHYVELPPSTSSASGVVAATGGNNELAEQLVGRVSTIC